MGEVEPLWEKVLDRLSENHPADMRHMARVSLDSVVDGVIVLAGPGTVIEAWEDRRRQDRLREAAKQILGREVFFEFKARQAKKAVDAAVVSEARYKLTRHPAVDKVKTLFDGVIVDCRPNEQMPDCGQQDEDNEEMP